MSAFTPGENTFRNAKLRTTALVVYKAAADVAAKGAMFTITVIAARRLSAWGFGVFAVGATVGWLLSVATDFGVQLHVARAVARTPHAAPELLRRWGRFRIAASVTGLAALALTLVLVRPGMQWGVPLLLFAAAYSATSLVEFLNYYYRGLSRSDVESTLTVVHRAATLVCGLVVLTWWPGPTPLALAMLIPSAAALTWSVRHAVADPARAIDGAGLPGAAEFFGDVFPIGLGIVLSALYFRIDILLLQWWTGTEAVGRYNAAFRVIEALRLFPAAVLAVMLPALCRAHDRALLSAVAAGVTGFAIVTSTILWFGAGRIVELLYGTAYRNAAPPFRVLALSFPLLSLNYALTHQLVIGNRHRAYALICALALACNLGLNAWLIPALATEGAAWATVGTEIVLTAGCLVALRARA